MRLRQCLRPARTGAFGNPGGRRLGNGSHASQRCRIPPVVPIWAPESVPETRSGSSHAAPTSQLLQRCRKNPQTATPIALTPRIRAQPPRTLHANHKPGCVHHKCTLRSRSQSRIRNQFRWLRLCVEISSQPFITARGGRKLHQSRKQSNPWRFHRKCTLRGKRSRRSQKSKRSRIQKQFWWLVCCVGVESKWWK